MSEAIELEQDVPISTEVSNHYEDLSVQDLEKKNLREIDRRIAAGYDVVALLRKNRRGEHHYLRLDFKGETPPVVLPELIELPPPTEQIPNRVRDALDHPMPYYAAAGVATESFFANHSGAEAA